VKKGDPQIWREGFAKELRARGVEAEATPRATRGVVKKGIDQAILHIRKRGLTPEVDKAKIKEIVEEFKDTRAGKPAKAKPWEKKIQTRQQEVRKGWLSAAQELNQSSEPGDKKLAADVVNFVNTMPPMATERHEMAKAVSQKLASQQPGKKQNSTGRDRDNDQEER